MVSKRILQGFLFLNISIFFYGYLVGFGKSLWFDELLSINHARELNNFSLKELTASQTAERKGINNNPNEDQIEKLKLLCENVLQKIRDHYKRPVTISSGYRSPELCEAIGSSKNSQHTKAEAADFEIFGLSNAELCKWISDNLEFDQMILEYHKLDEPNSGWIHCSYKVEDNRKQILRAYRNESGKTCYEAYEPK